MKTTIRQMLLNVLVVLTLTPCVFTQQKPKPLATIPVDVTGYGLIFLQARVNDSKPIWFVLDSGASSPFAIDFRRARALGLKLKGHLTLQGGAGSRAYEAFLTRGLSISINGLKFVDQTALVHALDSLEAQVGRAMDGLVGLDLFTRYVVEIDYIGKTITLYDPQTYTYSGPGESIPLTLRDGHLFVPAKFEMPGHTRLDGKFLVDTGGGMVTAVLTTPFAKSNNLPAPTQKTISDNSFSGLGGETKLLVSRATSFTIGNFVLREPVIYMSQDKGGALASSDFAGLLGGEILRRFKVIFDYARRRLILEPNAHFAEPVEYDMSGLRLRAYGDLSVSGADRGPRAGSPRGVVDATGSSGDLSVPGAVATGSSGDLSVPGAVATGSSGDLSVPGAVATGSRTQPRIFRVHQVLEDSPAAEAGLRVGDILTAIDGVAASRFSLDEIYKMLKQHGREYKLGIKRGGRTLSIRVKTRRMI